MNTFKNIYNETATSLSLRDLIHWKERGKKSPEYMLYQKEKRTIGLLDVKNGVAGEITFDNLEKANEFFREMHVDDNVITVVPSGDWVVYVP